MSAAVTRVTAALPMIGAEEAAAALETAVPITMKGQGPAWFLEELAAHMTAHPDALTSGSSLCPLVLLRLARVLHEAGHQVIRPGCAHCGKVTAGLRQLREQGRVCSSCASRSRKNGTCGRCAATGVLIVARRPDGGICGRCYQQDPEVVEECAECGRLQNPVVRLPGGGALCHVCWKRPLHTCVSCGKTAPAVLPRAGTGMLTLQAGPPLRPGHHRRADLPQLLRPRRAPAKCARCRQSHPLIGRDANGDGICGTCAGTAIDFTCRRCGRPGHPYGHDGCAYCVLADKVTELLTGPDGTIMPELKRLADALTQAHRPFTTIHWIRHSPAAGLLRQLIAQQRPVTHELLDELPPGHSLHYLRQVLVQTGILSQRDEDLERVPAWLEHHLAGQPPEYALLIRPFLHWSLLRRARRRAARRPFPASIGRQLRVRVLIALEFLAWTDQRGTTLAQLRQDDVDRWLGEKQTQVRYRVSYFLTWTADRSLSRRLTVPAVPSQQPADFLDDDQRWQLLQRCLTDTTMPIGVRAAGALVLLFGLQLQRIRHLTAGQITDKDGNAYLTAGRRPVLLPPRLGAILGELAAQPPPRLMIPNRPDAPRWLFPGRIPGQLLDLHSLNNQLNRHGISARPARNGALAARDADLPHSLREPGEQDATASRDAPDRCSPRLRRRPLPGGSRSRAPHLHASGRRNGRH